VIAQLTDKQAKVSYGYLFGSRINNRQTDAALAKRCGRQW